MDLKEKFEEQKAIDELYRILEELNESKFSKNLGHMVARNKQRTLQLKTKNIKKRSGENQEITTDANVGAAKRGEPLPAQPQGGVPQPPQPTDPRVARLAASLLQLANRGDMAKQNVLQLLNKALKKVGGA